MPSKKHAAFLAFAASILFYSRTLDGAYLWYRVSVTARAIKELYHMSHEDYDRFCKSYDVYTDPQGNATDEEKVVDSYKVLSPLLELGELEKMYLPPVMDKDKRMAENQELFEQQMATTVGLGPGKMALDLGCGKGLIADTVQTHTGAKVIGMNIDPWQLDRARENAIAKGKNGTLLEFLNGSFNDPLPFPDNTFDAVYGMAAWTHVHNLTTMLQEVRRVLKPGGMVSTLDAAMTDKYNPKNETQYRMFQHTRQVSLGPYYPLNTDYEKAFIDNGFTLKKSEFLGHSYFLKVARDYYQPLGSLMKLLGKVGIVSESVLAAMDRMNDHAMDILAGDQERLFTTCYWIVAQAS